MNYDRLLEIVSDVIEEFGTDYAYLEEAIAQAIYDAQGKDGY